MATPRGKIGRLPEALRAQVNGLLRDNKTAEEIIALLDAQGVAGVTPQNVSAWKKFGYQKWERLQDRVDLMRARRDMAKQMVEEAREDGDDEPHEKP